MIKNDDISWKLSRWQLFFESVRAQGRILLPVAVLWNSKRVDMYELRRTVL